MTNCIVRKTVVYSADWAKLSERVEARVMNKLHCDLAEWDGAEDRSMRAMALTDASDGIEVCAVIETGDRRAIEQRLRQMDTAARDHVYAMIEAELGMSWNQFTAVQPG